MSFEFFTIRAAKSFLVHFRSAVSDVIIPEPGPVVLQKQMMCLNETGADWTQPGPVNGSVNNRLCGINDAIYQLGLQKSIMYFIVNNCWYRLALSFYIMIKGDGDATGESLCLKSATEHFK